MRLPFKELKWLLAAVVAVVLTAAVLPLLIRAMTTPAVNACINNLRCIDGAKAMWSLENHKTTHDVPTWEDLRAYVSRDGHLPACPHGGTYRLGRVGQHPTCTHPGDVLPPDTSSAH